MEFPLYAIRGYREINIEGRYKIIQTDHFKFVLDDLSLMDTVPLYADRRVELLRRAIPYRMYPLDEIITSLESLVSSKRRVFIDKYGKLVRWNKKQFVPVKTRKIINTHLLDNGRWLLWADGLDHPFEVPVYSGETFLQFVYINKVPTLYKLHKEKVKDTRIKI